MLDSETKLQYVHVKINKEIFLFTARLLARFHERASVFVGNCRQCVLPFFLTSVITNTEENGSGVFLFPLRIIGENFRARNDKFERG